MPFQSLLTLALLIVGPAALHAQAQPEQERPAPDLNQQQQVQPAAGDQGPAAGDEAAEPDRDRGGTADGEASAADDADRDASGRPDQAADVDSARTDSAVGGGEAGPPEWMFGTYCTRSMSGRSPISRATYRPDNIVEVRPDGREQSLFLHWHIIASETNRSESVVTVEISGDTPNRETVYFRLPRADLVARRYFRAVIEDRRQMGWDDFSRRCAPIAVP